MRTIQQTNDTETATNSAIEMKIMPEINRDYIAVVELVDWDSPWSNNQLSGDGGVSFSMKVEDFVHRYGEEARKYVKALLSYLKEHKVKISGFEHQLNGVPLYNDSTVSRFSFRAWGDVMSAIWGGTYVDYAWE